MEMIDFDAKHAARRNDPETSHAAAQQAVTFAKSHAGRILAALKAYGPMTPHEMHVTGLTVVQCDRRLPEIARAGLARVVTLDDGHPMTRNGARVWEAVA
jgi:hypothetical protein